jgi:hypothetical protein
VREFFKTLVCMALLFAAIYAAAYSFNVLFAISMTLFLVTLSSK